MDSSSSSPNPNPNPNNFPTIYHQNPDINTTLSTLKHLIHLSKTTIHSLSLSNTPLPTTATCPHNPNHRLPPASLFRHHLRCPSSPAPLPNLTNDDANFFYRDCPAVVTFPQHRHHNAHRTLTLPDVLSAECAGDDDVTHTYAADGGFSKLLPSECYNVRTEINQWTDYPSFYSYDVVRLIVSSCCMLHQKDSCLKHWVLVSSPFYGVVIDVFMVDHMLLLFRLCFKAIAREASRHLVSVSKGEPNSCRFECPVLIRVLMWLASQFGVLYGEMNGKLFTINMLKHSLLNDSSNSLMLFDDETETLSGSKDIEGNGKRAVLVSQVEAAVAALHERFAFEARIKSIRASCFVPAYQRVQEHEYISKKADEERKKRSNYRPIIEHDGVLWHRGGNQDSNKNKSQEELLAEERDYKRRRMSYRGKKMKRSTTQVMRDIIDEYMQEIKHANMAGQLLPDATDLALVPSSISNVRADKHRHDEIKKNTLWKESVSDISMRSARYEDEAKEKNNINRHKDYRSSKRTKDHSSSPNNGQKSKHKDKGLSSILQNEFEDRYDPSKSHDIDF